MNGWLGVGGSEGVDGGRKGGIIFTSHLLCPCMIKKISAFTDSSMKENCNRFPCWSFSLPP